MRGQRGPGARLPRAGRALLVCLRAAAHVGAQVVLTVGALVSVNKIVEATIPGLKRRHPAVEIKALSRQFTDHRTAITTALSASSCRPGLMALEVACSTLDMYGCIVLPLAWRSLQRPVDTEWGARMAGPTVATLPLRVRFTLSSRPLTSGPTAGAVT